MNKYKNLWFANTRMFLTVPHTVPAISHTERGFEGSMEHKNTQNTQFHTVERRACNTHKQAFLLCQCNSNRFLSLVFKRLKKVRTRTVKEQLERYELKTFIINVLRVLSGLITYGAAKRRGFLVAGLQKLVNQVNQLIQTDGKNAKR